MNPRHNFKPEIIKFLNSTIFNLKFNQNNLSFKSMNRCLIWRYKVMIFDLNVRVVLVVAFFCFFDELEELEELELEELEELDNTGPSKGSNIEDKYSIGVLLLNAYEQ